MCTQEVVVIITDKILTVSNIKLLPSHTCLYDVFHCSKYIPFGGKVVIVVSNLFQLTIAKTASDLHHQGLFYKDEAARDRALR